MQYLWLTLKHKWFVAWAGLRIGVPCWRLLIHDWTKLLPRDLLAYNRQFFGAADRPAEFIAAWVRHQNAHPHHWEYWVPRTGHNRCTHPYPDNEPIPMPLWAVREMVADWIGASRAYEGAWPSRGDWPWLKQNFHSIRVHEKTRRYLYEVLRGQGFSAADWGVRGEGI